MNKKILIGLIIVLFLGIGTLIYNVTIGSDKINLTDEECFEFDEENGKITGYKSICDSEINIPNKIKGKEVKAIGSFAFARKEITKVKLPEGLIEIGIGAFEDNLIEKIEIPKSVTTIKTYAFRKNKIKKINIGENVTNIGMAAFNDNQMKEKQAFIYMRTEKGIDEETVVSYAGKERKRVVVPEQVTMLYVSSFADCGIEEIVLSDKLERIEGRALENNKLTSLRIPKSVIIINDGALSGNELKEIIVYGKENIEEFSNFDLTGIDSKIIKFKK